MEDKSNQYTGMLHRAFESLHGLPGYLKLMFTVGLILRLIVIFQAPLYEEAAFIPAFNDEVSHYNHILFQKNSPGFASQRMSVGQEYALTRGEVEYSQPPLYYQVGALLINVYGERVNNILLLRSFSAFLWYGALLVLAMLLKNRKIMIPVLLAGSIMGVAMIPSATINNDSLFAFYIAGVYGYIASFVYNGFSRIRVLQAALLAAIGVWIKISALVLWPMLIFTVFVGIEGSRIKQTLSAGLTALLAIVASFPLWIQRNLVYGSPLGYEHSSEGLDFNLKEAIVAFIYSLNCPWMELWGSYWVKISSLALVFLLFASLIILIIYRHRILAKLSSVERKILLIWSVGGLSGIGGWIYYAVKYFQADARLLLPASIFIAAILGWPLWYSKPSYQKYFGWGICLILLLPYIAWGIK